MLSKIYHMEKTNTAWYPLYVKSKKAELVKVAEWRLPGAWGGGIKKMSKSTNLQLVNK